MSRVITLPDPCVVILVGASGSGKSSFARKHFLPTQILSSDTMRGVVGDDELAQGVTPQAFEALHFLLTKRCELHRTTVIDATNVQKESWTALVKIAKKHHMMVAAIVFDLSERVCQLRNAERPDRQFGPHVVRNQCRELRRAMSGMRKERFRPFVVFENEEQVNEAVIERTPLFNDRREESGPFDIVGDVHGCLPELVELLGELGYAPRETADPWKESGSVWAVTPPEGRRLVLVGDLCDRGPDSVGVLKLVMRACEEGHAICLPGNHDVKLIKYLEGRRVSETHGLATTVAELAGETDEFKAAAKTFLEGLISHFVFDQGRLVVAHAGLPEGMQGRASGAVREFCLYGDTTGEIDEFGLPVRADWAKDYRGKALVVYGHVAVPEVEWVNNTADIDTGCVFGGKLTALRYPERELVSIAAKETYFEPVRPLASRSAGGVDDGVLDIDDILGRRHISTSLGVSVLVKHENAVAAVEVMSRFAADPRWLVYLPPTMSPCPTSSREDFLEYPEEAFEAYRSAGLESVVMEEKHMGSRAVVVLCRDEEAAVKRFRMSPGGETGVILTRTGRRFFKDEVTERALLEEVRARMSEAGLWEELQSDWVVLDCELMPWSAKAVELLKGQYAAVGSAAVAEGAAREAVWATLVERGLEGAEEVLGRVQGEAEAARLFREAYRRYCWTVDSVADYRLAPFHVMAAESGVFADRSHVWHMETIEKLVKARAGVSPILMVTDWRVVNLGSAEEVAAACAWWEERTAAGGEGTVVKPLGFVQKGPRGYVQPAMKVRGREYLRIIYGPDYLSSENLVQLKKRGLGRKQGLASKEFALGIEGLERFVRRESLTRVHECAFAVLALETEPVDPRL